MLNDNFKQPSFLNDNDKVVIISTARAINSTELTYAKEIINNYSLQCDFGLTIDKIEHQYAGTLKERLTDLQNSLDNPDIKAIVCARGGYGTAQLLPYINWTEFKKNPKWIIGYSDITALHSVINKLRIKSIHGTMPINVTKENDSTPFEKIIQIIKGDTENTQTLTNNKYNVTKDIDSTIIGGNLSVLYSLRGTKYEPNYKNKLLFIEDLDEYLYHIDRMMLNLELGEVLTQIKGLLVGGMTQMHDNTIPFGKSAEEIIYNYFAKYNKPLIFNFPAGHFNNNYPIILGNKTQITTNNNQIIIRN